MHYKKTGSNNLPDDLEDNSAIYQFIAVVDSFDEMWLSDLDCQPNYLHIHILKVGVNDQNFSQYLQKIKSLTSSSDNDLLDGILFQWGLPSDLKTKSRSVSVRAKHLKNFDTGIGSLARGNESGDEHKNSFIGGGEAFKLLDTNVRITKGNKFFNVSDEDGYWTFQAPTSKNAKIFNDVINQEIDGRNMLLDFLKNKSSGKPFFAVFNGQFIKDFYTRSNGIFPEDISVIEKPQRVLFESDEAIGGHLLGGTQSSGDLKSLQEKFTACQAKIQDFKIKFTSELIIIPSTLRIVKTNAQKFPDLSADDLATDQFSRAPRSQAKVLDATRLIQKLFRKKMKYPQK